MHLKRIIAAAVCILSVTACMAGCSDGDSSADTNDTAESVSAQPEVEVSETKLGSNLKRIAEIYNSGTYTLECTLTSNQFEGPVNITQVADGKDFYQLQTEKLGSHGEVYISGKGYQFDYVCGMYREVNVIPRFNIVMQIASQNIAPDSAPWLSDDVYDVERYTYAGDTYITVTDFYFSKSDGHLAKYVSKYTAEGKGEIEETRTVTKLEAAADQSVFNAYFTDQLVNFDSMSEDQKLGFCQGLCGSWGITFEELFEAGISSEDMRSVDYETLFRLVYKYGKAHDAAAPVQPEDSGDPAEESSQPDETDSADESELPQEQDSQDSQDSQAEEPESTAESGAASSEEQAESDASPEDSGETDQSSDDAQPEEEQSEEQ